MATKADPIFKIINEIFLKIWLYFICIFLIGFIKASTYYLLSMNILLLGKNEEFKNTGYITHSDYLIFFIVVYYQILSENPILN